MVKYLLKKSYQRDNLKEIKFDDLWNKTGVFTTMWIYGKPPKIIFFNSHIYNLIQSLKSYKLSQRNIRKIIQQKKIYHGFQSTVKVTSNNSIFKKNSIFKVGRYHSLKLKEPFMRENFNITMRCTKSDIAMGFENIQDDVYGFQFHPESFLTKNGKILIKKILSA